MTPEQALAIILNVKHEEFGVPERGSGFYTAVTVLLVAIFKAHIKDGVKENWNILNAQSELTKLLVLVAKQSGYDITAL